MSKVCTGDAGYITAPEQCAEQSVTPAAPADREYEAWLDRLCNEFRATQTKGGSNANLR